MIRAALTVGLLLGSLGSAWGYRVLEQQEDAYELPLVEVLLPGSEAGSVIFKACEDCRTTALRVGAATRYFVNGVEVELAELLRLAEDARQSAGADSAAVYLFFDIESQRVNRLRLSHRAQH
jgi:hypothetical protein